MKSRLVSIGFILMVLSAYSGLSKGDRIPTAEGNVLGKLLSRIERGPRNRANLILQKENSPA
jgi:hypothetical protein